MTSFKKIISSSFVLAALFAAGSAHAATLSISPTTVAVKAGQTVTLHIAIDPQASSVYTVKAVISFPANLLQETSYSQDSAWLPLAQKGYDSVDNVGGSMIKTAGYPSGDKAPAAFGTVTFKAIKTGVATVAIAPTSLAYNSSSQNSLAGTQGSAVVTISAAAVVPKASPSSTGSSVGASSTDLLASASTTADLSATATATASTTFDQAAAVGNANPGFFASIGWWWILIVVVIAALFATYRRYSNRNR